MLLLTAAARAALFFESRTVYDDDLPIWKGCDESGACTGIDPTEPRRGPRGFRRARFLMRV